MDKMDEMSGRLAAIELDMMTWRMRPSQALAN